MQLQPTRALNIQHPSPSHILMVVQINSRDLIIVKANEIRMIIQSNYVNHNSSQKLRIVF